MKVTRADEEDGWVSINLHLLTEIYETLHLNGIAIISLSCAEISLRWTRREGGSTKTEQ
jgi:hypothetical protein